MVCWRSIPLKGPKETNKQKQDKDSKETKKTRNKIIEKIKNYIQNV